MPLLDDLSGQEFEALMVDVFRNSGYQNVQQTPRTGDEGRDILMTETVNGRQRGVVVECKHMDRVGREVIQKLHSAVVTYDRFESNRGIVITSGTFTPQAQEYIQTLETNGDGTQIELIDGNTLRDIADEVGLDLRNGNIELICTQTFSPVDPDGDSETPVTNQLEHINNIAETDLDQIESAVRFWPVLSIATQTDAVFETGVGVIHRVNEQDDFLIHGDSTPPRSIDDSLGQLLTDSAAQTVDLETWNKTDVFTETTVDRFSHSESEIEEWVIDRLQSQYATTVEYTGDNNIDYEKECVPAGADISIDSLTPMYVPRIRSRVHLNDRTYTVAYDSAGSKRDIRRNDLSHCVHCGWSWTALTYCDNCGSINCWRHIRTERLEQTPICTDCAVTDRFGLRKRYFSTEDNRDAFRSKYEEMPLHGVVRENTLPIAVIAVVLTALLIYVI